jgi:tRNA-dihydrouridine synthase B
MAGITDLPFRKLCRRMGAGLAVSEMVISNPEQRNSRKTRQRIDHTGEAAPRVVQIVGADPLAMAAAARFNVEQGADIIDINMGCPAKKVLNRAAGSALLRDEPLVEAILRAVLAAVEVPVTLKIRTGWDPQQVNATVVGTIAQDCGISALTVHGRTRQCRFAGRAEYDTIARVVDALSIPVIANGDIDSPEQARRVQEYTGAAGVMIGRAAQGNPWIFSRATHLLQSGEALAPPGATEVVAMMDLHLRALHRFYGKVQGVRIARKHIGWYAQRLGLPGWRRDFNTLECAAAQIDAIARISEATLQRDIAA